MKLYSIRNWNALYENNRSRTVKELGWVAIPNHHDGENYSAIITHQDGAIIFSAWVLIIQVASRCHPRGTLLRDNQTPHTPQSLSLKTRAPKEWFSMALDFLETRTDWIVSEDFTDGCQQGVSQLSVGCQHGDEEGKGREGKGMNGIVVVRDHSLPTLDDVMTECEMRNHPKLEGEKFWNHFEGMGWVDKNSNPVVKWRQKLASWCISARSTPPASKSKSNRPHCPNLG